MAINTAQKRMSAMQPMCPWRGALVDASETGFTFGNRRAAGYAYSGLVGIVIGGPFYTDAVGWLVAGGSEAQGWLAGADPAAPRLAGTAVAAPWLAGAEPAAGRLAGSRVAQSSPGV